ncbi:MAG: hypothetical protein KA386_02690 [Leptothrix sp. (in: Bacteria)]|nr:hypothetical protein [Leptothrix sp. (in: b-proteobacteria)]
MISQNDMASVELGSQIDLLAPSPDGVLALVVRVSRRAHTPLVILDINSMAARETVVPAARMVWALFLNEDRILYGVDDGPGFVQVFGLSLQADTVRELFRWRRGRMTAPPYLAGGRLVAADGRWVRVFTSAELIPQTKDLVPGLSGEILCVSPARVCTRSAGGIEVLERTTGRVCAAIEVVNPEECRDSGSLVWVRGEFGQGLFAYDADGQRSDFARPINDPGETCTSFAISPEERSVLIGNASGWVSVFDLRSGTKRWSGRIHRGRVTAACFDVGARFTLTGDSAGRVCRVALGRARMRKTQVGVPD